MARSLPDNAYGFRFVEAGWFWGSIVLRPLGFAGIVVPWRRIYLLPEHFNSRLLRRHEAVHVRQMYRDGHLRYWFMSLWYILRHGYWNSPYEIEARAAAPHQNGEYWPEGRPIG